MKQSRKLLSLMLTALLMAALLVPTMAFGSTTNEVSLEESSELVRVNVMMKANSSEEVKNRILLLDGKVLEEWKFINTVLAEMEPSKVNELKTVPGVISVSVEDTVVNNSTISLNFDPKKVQAVHPYTVEAEAAWKEGITGKGVTVAVLDSGVNSEGNSDFGRRIVAEEKTNSNAAYIADKYGHGTHVAGIIAGNGKNSDSKYIGIAPGANLINVKFSGDDGSASETDLVNGIQWVYENKDKYNIRVVNISANIGAIQSYKESPTAAAVEMLWHSGIVVVVSAGNNGGGTCSVCHAPSNDPFVISVGAIDDNNTKNLGDDYFKTWSSVGATKDNHLKPEIAAPGSEIVAYMPSGDLKSQAPGNVVEDKYFKMGGTSMSAPVVTGIVALMLEKNPNLTPNEVKWLLMQASSTNTLYADETLVDKADKVYPYVPGLVNAKKAVFWEDAIGVANQGLEIHPAISEAMSDDMTFSDMSWSNMSWSNMSWSNMSWSNSFDK